MVGTSLICCNSYSLSQMFQEERASDFVAVTSENRTTGKTRRSVRFRGDHTRIELSLLLINPLPKVELGWHGLASKNRVLLSRRSLASWRCRRNRRGKGEDHRDHLLVYL